MMHLQPFSCAQGKSLKRERRAQLINPFWKIVATNQEHQRRMVLMHCLTKHKVVQFVTLHWNDDSLPRTLGHVMSGGIVLYKNVGYMSSHYTTIGN